MNIQTWSRFSEKYTNLAKRVGEALFVLCLFCVRLIVLFGELGVLLCIALTPAYFLWILLDFLAVSTWGKVLFAVIWTFLWGLSILVLNCLFGQAIKRIRELHTSLNSAIDDWLKREKLTVES